MKLPLSRFPDHMIMSTDVVRAIMSGNRKKGSGSLLLAFYTIWSASINIEEKFPRYHVTLRCSAVIKAHQGSAVKAQNELSCSVHKSYKLDTNMYRSPYIPGYRATALRLCGTAESVTTTSVRPR